MGLPRASLLFQGILPLCCISPRVLVEYSSGWGCMRMRMRVCRLWLALQTGGRGTNAFWGSTLHTLAGSRRASALTVETSRGPGALRSDFVCWVAAVQQTSACMCMHLACMCMHAALWASQVCQCTIEDYECEYGFERAVGSVHCLPTDIAAAAASTAAGLNQYADAEDVAAAAACTSSAFFYTAAYRKVCVCRGTRQMHVLIIIICRYALHAAAAERCVRQSLCCSRESLLSFNCYYLLLFKNRLRRCRGMCAREGGSPRKSRCLARRTRLSVEAASSSCC